MLRVLLLLAVLLPFSAAAQSVPGAGHAILTIVPERLFGETRAGKAALARSDQDTNALVAENRRLEAELASEERALTEKRDTLPPDQFRPLAEAFDVKAERVRDEQEAKARDLNRRLDDARQNFFKAARAVLGRMAEEAGAMVILDQGSVVLSSDQIDITDEAILRLDAELGESPSLYDPSP